MNQESLNGVIVIKKETGMTSHDVVEKVSRILGIKKVGHTGTLDPMAEGVLVVCLGQATKIAELLTAYDKEYIADIKLGITTDTYDQEGKVLEEKEVPEGLPIEEVLSSFQKTYLQEVPIYSAVKVNGKKLYEYAREKKEVELPKKEVTIYKIELLEKTKDTLRIQVKVSKGCYIRSLIHEIGEALGVGAIMTSLTRTKQGNISIEDAYTLEEIEQGNCKIKSIEDSISFPIVEVEEDLAFKIHNGQKIKNQWNIEDKVLFKTKEKILGIYEKGNDFLKVWKNFQ
ncbi:MAG: tRNA pseudouridine(55) synthase TruB [Bacilli bacterium]|nr:tRNA pseudouridine(55) synthase TruB [Bacilli bacterium]